MPRETKHDKAVRILAERRLTVELAGDPGRPGLVVASCRGESEATIYRLGHDPTGGRLAWRCTCEANKKFRRECSHLLALKLVVTVATPS